MKCRWRSRKIWGSGVSPACCVVQTAKVIFTGLHEAATQAGESPRTRKIDPVFCAVPGKCNCVMSHIVGHSARCPSIDPQENDVHPL